MTFRTSNILKKYPEYSNICYVLLMHSDFKLKRWQRRKVRKEDEKRGGCKHMSRIKNQETQINRDHPKAQT